MKQVGIAACALLPVVLFGGLMLSSTSTTSHSAAGALEGVPAEYVEDVMKAGAICPEVTPSIIAAQIEAESAWNPRAVSPVGAQGLTQFMPQTWKAHGKDGNADGIADPFNPHDAIASQGANMCHLVAVVKEWGYTSNTITIALAAYNAGLGNVRTHGGIPPFAETQAYVEKITTNAAKKNVSFSAVGGSSALVSTAKKYLGVPYVWGGTTPLGLDCSGLIVRSYADMGKPLSVRTADEITRTYAHLNPVKHNQLKPGDLISLRRPGTGHYYHIGIYAGLDADGTPLYLHAPTEGQTVSIVPLHPMLAGEEWTAFRI